VKINRALTFSGIIIIALFFADAPMMFPFTGKQGMYIIKMELMKKLKQSIKKS